MSSGDPRDCGCRRVSLSLNAEPGVKVFKNEVMAECLK